MCGRREVPGGRGPLRHPSPEAPRRRALRGPRAARPPARAARPSHTSASLLRPSIHIECVAASGGGGDDGGGDEDREQLRDAALADALEERLHLEDFDWFIEQTLAAPASAPAPADLRTRQFHSSLTHCPKSTALDADEQPCRTPRPSNGTRAGAGAGESADGDGGEDPPVDVERVERTVSLLLQPPQYGFALRSRSRLLGALSSELRELIELPDPDQVLCIFSMHHITFYSYCIFSAAFDFLVQCSIGN